MPVVASTRGRRAAVLGTAGSARPRRRGMVIDLQPAVRLGALHQPLTAGLGVSLPQVQITFSILIVVQTFLSPAQGLLVDRFGPRLLLSIGTVRHRAELGARRAGDEPAVLYLTYGLARRHRHRHRLHRRRRPHGAVVSRQARSGHRARGRRLRHGRAALRRFRSPTLMRDGGLPGGAWRFGLVFARRRACWPRKVCDGPTAAGLAGRDRRSSAPRQPHATYRPGQMLRTPIFWLMFVMMTMMSTSGLMVTSQMGAFTADFGMAERPGVRAAAAAAGALARSHHQRRDASVLRLGVRSDRPREHDVHRLRARGAWR